MIDYSKDKRDDRSKERLRQAEARYQSRITEGVIILVTGAVIVATFCVVLF